MKKKKNFYKNWHSDSKHIFTHWIIFILVSLLIISFLTNKIYDISLEYDFKIIKQVPRNKTITPVNVDNEPNIIQKTKDYINSIIEFSPKRLLCIPYDGHNEGILIANFDENEKLIGWSCNMGSHMNCTAGPDGIWKECDFPPSDMVWPNPVPKEALDNPKIYVSPYEELTNE